MNVSSHQQSLKLGIVVLLVVFALFAVLGANHLMNQANQALTAKNSAPDPWNFNAK